MIILGIDPGTATTGYGLIRKSKTQNIKSQRDFKCLDYGVILTKPGTPDADRLKKLYNELVFIIREHKPDFLAVERLYFFKNAKTVIPVAQAKGMVLLAAAKKNIPVFEFTPLQVKMTVVGYGRAEKSQVQEMIKVMLGLEKIPKPDDAADALGVAICCANSLR